MTHLRFRASIVPLSFLVLFGVQTLSSAETPSAAKSLEEKIIQMERDRQDAFVRGDVDFLDRGTADDYTTINASGAISDKAKMMNNLHAAKTKVVSVTLDEMKARVYGKTAVLTGHYKDVHVTDGEKKEVDARFTRIFSRTSGRWLAVAYQQTLVAPK